jgi:hypothetical protein
MNRLEEFIKENRGAFDSYEPDKKIWNRLNNDLQGGRAKTFSYKKIQWITLTALAASLFFLFFMIYNESANHRMEKNQEANNTTLPEEYADEVDLFTRLIQIKHEDLKEIKTEEPELYSKFSSDILKLDSNYQQLKKQLPGNPNESILLDAMIENLHYQMELLDQQLIIINKIKQAKKRHNEKFKSS